MKYKCLGNLGYVHTSCNHSIGEYVAPGGTNTNAIENLWCNMKSKFKQMRGSCESQMPLHLDEFQYGWNRKSDGNIFDLFLEDIAKFYNCK